MKKHKKILSLMLSMALILGLCPVMSMTAHAGQNDVTGITITGSHVIAGNPKTLVMDVAQREADKESLSYTVTPGSENPTVTWSSSNPSVASVNNSGVVTGLAEGYSRVTLTVTGTSVSDYVDVYVMEPSTIYISSITVSPRDNVSGFATGHTYKLDATVSPSNATDKRITWSSSNPSVVSVDLNGWITCNSAGTSTISATSMDGSGKSGTYNVTVTSPVYVSGINITNKSSLISLNKGNTGKINVSLTPSNITEDYTINYVTSNNQVIQTTGEDYTAVGAGDATITVTATDEHGSVSDTVSVTVTDTGSPSSDPSSDPSTPPVQADKTVTGVHITSGRNHTLSLEMKKTGSNATTLQYEVYPTDATNKKVAWTSFDTSVITVDSNGTITPKKAGTSRITVTADDTSNGTYSDYIDVTVTVKEEEDEEHEDTVLSQSVSISVYDSEGKSVSEYMEGMTYNLSATILPSNTTNKSVTWSSSDTDIVSVDVFGNMKCLKTGNVTITVRTNDTGKSSTLSVKVVEKEELPEEDPEEEQNTVQSIFRLYNPNSGEHFYTTSELERDNCVVHGWTYEGVAFTAEVKDNSIAVYRVYNPNSGLHHYTKDINEVTYLTQIGWNYEGTAFYSIDPTEEGAVPVHRLYCPNDGQHHYTKDTAEKDYLVSIGWNYEGTAYYGK